MHDYHDRQAEIVSWTRAEKERALKAIESHERSANFYATLKRVMATVGGVLAFWVVLKQVAGQGWSELIALLGGRLPK